MTEDEKEFDDDCKRLIALVDKSHGTARDQAFAQLYELCKGVVWSFAANHFDTTDENWLDPICEEVLYYVGRRASAYKSKGKFTTWLFKITETFCLKARRDEGRYRRHFRVSAETPEVVREEPESDVDPFDVPEFRRVLEAALAELDPDKVRVWRLHMEEGLPKTKIEELTGVPDSTIDSQIKAINAKLRPLFERFG